MCLAEVGLSPDRMMCSDDYECAVGCGTGDEGFSFNEIDRLTDRAIALANAPHPPQTKDVQP